MESTIIIASDLSLNGSAFAVIEIMKSGKFRVIDTEYVDNSKIKSEYTPKKLKNISDTFDSLVKRYDNARIVRERGFARFNKATRKLGMVEGVYDLVLVKNGYEKDTETISPTTIKKVITGSGRAKKPEVSAKVRELFSEEDVKGVNFNNNDITDAIAVGITYAIENRLIIKPS